MLFGLVIAGQAFAASSDPRPASIPAGFAPSERTNFAPVLKLAAPGPHRAERAMAALDRQLILQRLALHPQFSPSLEHLFDEIPPRNSTLIRAATMYSRTDVAWTNIDGTHEICAEGYPKGEEFYVTTSPSCQVPNLPLRLDAYFALKPPAGVTHTSASISSVIGTLGARIETNTFGFGAIVDAIGQMLTEVYGDLAPPWDVAPGAYNHHDVASRERFRRELPTVDDKFHEYLKYNNILDEFDGPGGPYVLFNFAGEVQARALKKYPDLYRFYENIAPTLTAEADVMDEQNHYWMRNGFDRGKVWMTFMARGGKLSAFDAAYHPVGEPIALGSLHSGVNRTRSSIRIRRLGMNFGLDNLSFTNYFTRNDLTISFEAHMDAIPQVVAPVGIQQGAELVAGEFMRTIAQGSGGMRGQIASQEMGDGTIQFTSQISAEFMYSPALEFFAAIGDSIANEHDAKVREQERRLIEEFLDAFIKDYNNARSRILALDQDPELMR